MTTVGSEHRVVLGCVGPSTKKDSAAVAAAAGDRAPYGADVLMGIKD